MVAPGDPGDQALQPWCLTGQAPSQLERPGGCAVPFVAPGGDPVERRIGQLAGHQVLAGRLAEALAAALGIQHIVGDLEQQPPRLAEFPQPGIGAGIDPRVEPERK